MTKKLDLTRSRAVAERPRDAPCRWKSCFHSRSFDTPLRKITCKLFDCNYVSVSYCFWDTRNRMMEYTWNATSLSRTVSGTLEIEWWSTLEMWVTEVHRKYLIVYYTIFCHCKFSCTVPFSNYLTMNNVVTFRGHSRSLEIAPFDRSHTSSYWHSTVTMALYCIISKIKRDSGLKWQFFHTAPAYRRSR